MNANEEEQRRERLRELQKLRGQTPPVKAEGSVDSPTEENNSGRGKLRELLQRRQSGNAGNPQGGGGRLLQALAGRAGGGAGGNQAGGGLLRAALANRGEGGQQGRSLGTDGQGAGNNRGMLLRRLMEGRQNEAGSQPSDNTQALSELTMRVNRLTEEVEKLRANQAAAPNPAPAGSSETKKDSPRPGATAPGKRGKKGNS